MKSIIEKLGLKTPDEISLVRDVWAVYDLAGLSRPRISYDNLFENAHILKSILDNKNEMLEALIELTKEKYQKELRQSLLNGYNDFDIARLTVQPYIALVEKAMGKNKGVI